MISHAKKMTGRYLNVYNSDDLYAHYLEFDLSNVNLDLKLRGKVAFFVGLINFCFTGVSPGASQLVVGAGSAAFHGDLSSEPVTPAYLLSYRKVEENYPGDMSVLAGSILSGWYAGFEIFMTKTAHDGDQRASEFPTTPVCTFQSQE